MELNQLNPAGVGESFGPGLLDVFACREYVLRATRGENPCCPSCGTILDDHRVRRLLDGKAIVCRCGVQSSARTGTILEGSTITDTQLVLILLMTYWDFPVPEIAQVSGCSKQSVYNWRNRLGK